MKLTIYTDESMAEVKEVLEVPRMKIPYRTSVTVVNMLADLDLDSMNEMAIFGMLTRNMHHITTIVRATFGLSEDDLDHIDTMELVDLGKDIVKWVLGELAKLGIDLTGGETDPNATAQAQTTA